MFALLLVVELVSRIFQTVVETITRRTIGHFRFKSLFQPASRRFRNSGRENNAFSFLYTPASTSKMSFPVLIVKQVL